MWIGGDAKTNKGGNARPGERRGKARTAVQAGGLIVGEALLEPQQQVLQGRHGLLGRTAGVEARLGRRRCPVLLLEEGHQLRARQGVLVRLVVVVGEGIVWGWGGVVAGFWCIS